MVLVGLFVIHGLGQIREKSDHPTALKYLPPGLLTMAALLVVLQPEFNLAEVGIILMGGRFGKGAFARYGVDNPTCVGMLGTGSTTSLVIFLPGCCGGLGTGSAASFVIFLQLWESFVILVTDHSQLPVDVTLAAW